jgi:hypothetical protein
MRANLTVFSRKLSIETGLAPGPIAALSLVIFALFGHSESVLRRVAKDTRAVLSDDLGTRRD